MQVIWTNDRFLEIKDAYRQEILKPTIAVEDTYLDINMLYFQKDKIVIQLRDENGIILYNHSFKTFGSLNKRLNINDLAKGNYQLDIQTNVFTVSEKFEIDKEKMLFAGDF